MRDYTYIEQLLERYWECQTTLEEEAILRSFFQQDDVPVSLLQYRQLFAHQEEETISEDFEDRIMHIIDNEEPVKARVITMSQRLHPFMRAAAIVAVIITLGTAIETALAPSESPYPENYGPLKPVNKGTVAMSDTLKADTAKTSTTTSYTIVTTD